MELEVLRRELEPFGKVEGISRLRVDGVYKVTERVNNGDNGPCAKQEHYIVPYCRWNQVPRVIPWAASDMHDLCIAGASRQQLPIQSET